MFELPALHVPLISEVENACHRKGQRGTKMSEYSYPPYIGTDQPWRVGTSL
jgi:hypothetical protein